MLNLKKITRITALFALILGLSLSTAYAQESNQSTETYKLTLKVVDAESGEALPNAKIEILGIYEPHTTNTEGQLVFEEMETDPHTFKIYADGYETWIKTLTVTKESQLTVKLKPTG
jgi:ribosomal protein S16